MKKVICAIWTLMLTSFLLVFSLFSMASTATIANSSANNKQPPLLIPPPPTLNAKGFVLMDANTGKILAAKNMNTHLSPASLTKLMTLYIISKSLAEGQIKLGDKVRISKEAWRTGGSRMFLKLGSHVPVKDLIQGIIVASGNDACVAASEFIAGNQQSFAHLMNLTATQLGMKNTHYVDPTGLPQPNHYSTPYDLALLTRAIINQFPQYYHWYKQKWITWNGIKQANRNRLLWRDPEVDGLKTGHTKSAGYCLIASADRFGTRLISVVMGTPSESARANESQALLNWGFRFYKTYKLFSANQIINKHRVWLGEKKYIPFGLMKDFYITIPVGEYAKLKASMAINPKLKAPIIQGKAYGQVKIVLNGKPIANAPLIALENDPEGGMWTQFIDHIALFFKGWFQHNKTT